MQIAVGLDEAGRGPVLGPLVVGICAIPETDIALLEEQGVRDSKDLKPARRAEIERWFNQQCSARNWFGTTVTLGAERIDMALQDQGLNMLEVEGFQEAIELLPAKRNVSIMADACDVNADRFTQRIQSGLTDWPWPKSNMSSEHKADSNHLVVAMASILAKEERERSMAWMQERIGQPIGSGYPSDPATKSALDHLCQQAGIDVDVRWGWATIERFWNENRQGDVPRRGQRRTEQQRLFQS